MTKQHRTNKQPPPVATVNNSGGEATDAATHQARSSRKTPQLVKDSSIKSVEALSFQGRGLFSPGNLPLAGSSSGLGALKECPKGGGCLSEGQGEGIPPLRYGDGNSGGGSSQDIAIPKL